MEFYIRRVGGYNGVKWSDVKDNSFDYPIWIGILWLIVDSFIKIDDHRLNSPYIVKAIGNKTTLEASLTQKKSGYIDKTIKPYDKIATIETSDQIHISKYDKEISLRYIEGEK